MTSQRFIVPLRWITIGVALAAIVAVYRLWFHANAATVALTLLLLTLFLAARWGLRYAVVTSIAATLCYNFFFLPPFGTWSIEDPQNWIALLAFLITSVIASRLSIRIREEAREARRREHEVDVLFRLSRELLQTDNVVELLRTVPDSVARVTGAPSAAVYLGEGNLLYRSASASVPTEERPEDMMLLPRVTRTKTGAAVPLRTGVRPRGVLLLGPTILSDETLEALGGLISISLDRVQALENAARSEAAKESERLRSLMLDSITHELRTPLTAIKASATTMLSSALLSKEDHHELLTVIDEETDRLNRLIAQAVEMAQLDTQEIHMNLRPANVEDVVRQSVHACATQLAAREVSISAADGEPPRVLIDGIWLQKTFCNLLENAVKYSPAGSPVNIEIVTGGESIAVHITDRGVGIAASEQTLIFEKFYRGRAQAHRRPGTGMGLAISRAIVEAHRGTIRVSSAPGQGSTFTVELPVWHGTARSNPT